MHTRDGKRCGYNQAAPNTWFCNRHLDKLYNLTIKPSAIKGAGMGLFAGSEGFRKGDIIGEYSRYDIKGSPSKIFKHCSTHNCTAYIYCSDKECWDAKNTPSVIVRFSNDARSERKNNASFDEMGRRVFMMADKRIPPGAEIFCDYGEDYDWSFLDE
jgi:hypothetical protein